MPKIRAGLVAFGDKLGLFGGYGLPSGPTQPGSSFIKNKRFSDVDGWTNEFHVYNLKEGDCVAMYAAIVKTENTV